MSAKRTNSNMVTETTPLIGNTNGEASNPRSNGITHRGSHYQHPRGIVFRTLFDRKATPGTNSDNVVLRTLASLWHVTKVTLGSDYVNILIFMVPIGIIAGELGWDATVVFTINFFAIVPLAAILSFATEQISEKVGASLGGLLNATFGNAVEMIVSIIALKDNQIEVVQASMLGSILSNILLVMGMCFLFGGIRHRRKMDANGNYVGADGTEQKFNDGIAQTTCSMMTMSSASLVLPAALYGVLNQGKNTKEETMKAILILSRGTAIFLLGLYVLYLVFELITHPNLFDPTKNEHRSLEDRVENLENQVATMRDIPLASTEEVQEDEEEEISISSIAAIAVLVVTTILVSICADFLVGSIDNIVEKSGMSKAFIGLILLPIVGNAAEHVTAVVMAWKNKMDGAMAVAIGSSIQIALLVTPFLVIVGWIIDRPMSLRFETFQTVAFAVSILVVTYAVQDGRSNYLEGAMLLGLYAIIALAFFATPGLDSA